MSSVVANPHNLGPHLLPPQPPPQPPPIPSVSPVSRSVSPNNSYSKSPPPPPLPIAKPTTAGLLRFPSLPDSNPEKQFEPQTNRSLSPQFKQELLAKQSALKKPILLENDDGDATSIEDKIRLNKMFNNRQQQRVPDKLLSAMQKETKPFAYTVNVSDPNNRGKLDLSQIKSPIMRRRLLANMSSTEERDFDDDDDCDDFNTNSDNVHDLYDDDDDQDVDVIIRSETISPQFSGLKTSSPSEQNRITTSRYPQQKTISFSPIVSFTYVDRDPQMMNANTNSLNNNNNNNNYYTKVNQAQESDSRRPIIRHYEEPPKFYTRTPNIVSSSSSSSRERSTMDRLDAEMAETLDDFERMLSDMSTNEQQSSAQRAAPFQPTRPQVQRYNQPQISNRWPTNYSNNLTGQQSWSYQDSPQRSTNCMSCPHNGGLHKEERTSRNCLRTFQA